jgi:uncharacterized protein (TIGR01655 family)
MMKRITLAFAVLAMMTTVLMGCNLNRAFKDEYYVKITVDGTVETGKASGGQQYTNYKYSLAGFDKDGTEKTMEFNADKNLRKDAYLQVYYSEDKGVTSWQEVEKKDVPEKALGKLEPK